MDTKSKNNKTLGIIISILLVLAAVTAHFLISLPVYEANHKQAEDINIYNTSDFEHQVAAYIMGAYWKLHQDENNRQTPFEFYVGGAEGKLQQYIDEYIHPDEDGEICLRMFREGFNDKIMEQ